MKNTHEAAEADLASRQEDFVWNLSDDFIACRQGHDMPPFAFRRNRLPAGISAIGPYPDGHYDVLRTCRRCGKVLVYHTSTDGRITSWKPSSRYPHGFLAKGMGRISRTLIYDEGFDRIGEALISGATKPTAEEE